MTNTNEKWEVQIEEQFPWQQFMCATPEHARRKQRELKSLLLSERKDTEEKRDEEWCKFLEKQEELGGIPKGFTEMIRKFQSLHPKEEKEEEIKV